MRLHRTGWLRAAGWAAVLALAAASGVLAEGPNAPAQGPAVEHGAEDPPLTPAPPREEAAPEAGALESVPPERAYLDADAFRAAFEGKTVHLTDGALHYGSEHYLPGDKALWQGAGGPCRQGAWVYTNPLFCFTYTGDGPHCWRVFQAGDVYYAESTDGLLLRIYQIDASPLDCAPALLS